MSENGSKYPNAFHKGKENVPQFRKLNEAVQDLGEERALSMINRGLYAEHYNVIVRERKAEKEKHNAKRLEELEQLFRSKPELAEDLSDELREEIFGN